MREAAPGSCLQVTTPPAHNGGLSGQKSKVLRQWVTQIAVEVRPAVLEHRQLFAQLLQIVEVNSGKAKAWSFRAAGHHRSPGIYHHAVAITGSLLMVAATLCCRHYVALGFNGTGPQQHLGMEEIAVHLPGAWLASASLSPSLWT